MCLSMVSVIRSGRIQATILFASETGKSETFSKRLEKILYSSYNTRVLCMNDYDFNEISSEKFLIVVTSTFGSGEPPDNGKDFWVSLKKMKESGQAALKDLKYSIFALGSKSYPKFCKFGKDIDKMLSDLGGERMIPVEMGDELRGQEHTFNSWLPQIYKTSCKIFQLDVSEDLIIPAVSASTWKTGQFRFVPTNGQEKNVLIELSKLHHKKLIPMTAQFRTKLQAPFSERQTLLIRLKVENGQILTYEAGDHLAVYPTNPPNVVKSVLAKIQALGYDVDSIMKTEYLKDGIWKQFDRLPPASLRTYLSRYLDITTPPNSSFLHVLSNMATIPLDKYRLNRLSEVTEDYEAWKSFRFPNLAELLIEFPSVQLDPTALVLELPLLQPRYYSISSSRVATPDEVHLTVALVSYRTLDNKGPVHHGVCTSFLNNFPEEEIPCFVRNAPQFRLPKDPKSPVIMVGAGSGIAPFRSFWMEREALLKKQKGTKGGDTVFGPMFLFFGCRQSYVDNIYGEETASMVKKGVLSNVFTAFSREPGMDKKYVQHRLEDEAGLVSDILSKGGHIYVCGDAVMAEDVRCTVDRILSKCSKEINVEQLVESAHYHEDVFGVLHRR